MDESVEEEHELTCGSSSSFVIIRLCRTRSTETFSLTLETSD
jgi:hypothetical protein